MKCRSIAVALFLTFSLWGQGTAERSCFLPHVANGEFLGGSLRTTIILVNPNDQTVAVTVEFSGDAGAELKAGFPSLGTSPALSLEAGGTRFLQSLGTGDLVTGAARLVTDSDAAVGMSAVFTVYDEAGRFLTEAGVGASPLLEKFRFPVDAFGLSNTALAVYNPNQSSADLTLRMFNTEGQEVAVAEVKLEAREHLARFLAGEFFEGFADFRGTVTASSDVPVSACTIRQKTSPLSFTTLPVVSTESEITEFHLPQVASGGFEGGSMRTTFIVFTTSDLPASVAMTATDDSGAEHPLTLSNLGTDSRFVFDLPAGGSLYAETDGAGELFGGAVRLTSDAPIGVSAVFSVFDVEGRCSTEAGVGDSRLMPEFSIPVDIQELSDTGLALLRPAGAESVLELDLLDRCGATVGETHEIKLGQGEHLARFVSEIFPGTAGFQGSLSVRASNPLAALTMRQNTVPLTFTTLPVVDRALTPGEPTASVIAKGENSIISGNGEIVAFYRDGEIFVINFDGTMLRQVTEGAVDLSVSYAHVGDFAINTDGSQIVYSTDTRNTDRMSEIFLVDTTLGDRLEPVRVAPGFRPSISGDGTMIVFQDEGGISEGEAAVYIFDRRTNETRRLSPIAEDCSDNLPCHGSFHPKISADGSTVVFVSRELLNGHDEFFAVNPDGSNLRQITFGDDGSEATISGDGSRMVWSENYTDGSTVTVMNTDGSGLRILPGVPDNPDDIQVRLHSAISGCGCRVLIKKSVFWPHMLEIYVVDYCGSGLKLVLREDVAGATISHDGKRLVVQGMPGEELPPITALIVP
jgi:Tol biopolymer transport system component